MTYAPARLARKIAAPAMSSGRPMRFKRRRAPRCRSPKSRSVAAIIFDSNGPGAIAFTVMCLRPRLPGEVTRQLVDRGLARRVGVRLEHRDLDPVDRTDVDHPRRVVGVAAASSKRQERARQKERRLDVEVEHLVPRVGGKLGEGRTPGRARVVHEHVQAASRARRSPPRAGCRRLRRTGRPAGSRTSPIFESSAATSSHTSRLAGGDVDLRPGLDVPSGDHRSDPAAPAGHEGGLAIDAEQIRHAFPLVAGVQRATRRAEPSGCGPGIDPGDPGTPAVTNNARNSCRQSGYR